MQRRSKVMEVSRRAHKAAHKCYSRCKKINAARPELWHGWRRGARMPSAAFNYSLGPQTGGARLIFLWSPSPRRSRQMESLDLSVQRNTGSESRNSQSYFNGVMEKKSGKSRRGPRVRGERRNHV